MREARGLPTSGPHVLAPEPPSGTNGRENRERIKSSSHARVWGRVTHCEAITIRESKPFPGPVGAEADTGGSCWDGFGFGFGFGRDGKDGKERNYGYGEDRSQVSPWGPRRGLTSPSRA